MHVMICYKDIDNKYTLTHIPLINHIIKGAERTKVPENLDMSVNVALDINIWFRNNGSEEDSMLCNLYRGWDLIGHIYIYNRCGTLGIFVCTFLRYQESQRNCNCNHNHNCNLKTWKFVNSRKQAKPDQHHMKHLPTSIHWHLPLHPAELSL